MKTDLARRRIVLFGDMDQWTWEWDGSNWQLRAIASPGSRGGCALAYDTVRREIVLFGGYYQYYNSTHFDDTWVYRTATPADFSAYGSGCAGSAGTPSLAAADYTLPWLGDSFASFGLSGCESFVTTDTVSFRTAANGIAVWTANVPNTTALAGVHFYQQAVVFDAGAPGGAVVSNAGEAVIGIR
jgi:hypothetical protein